MNSKISPVNSMSMSGGFSMNTNINISEEYIKKFIYGYEKYVDTKYVDLNGLVKQIKDTLPDRIVKNDFYNYVADTCVALTSYHPDYNKLASRILVDRLHKNTPNDILEVIELLYNNSLVTKNLLNNARRFHNKLQETMNMDRDYLFDYFGIRTLEKSYLLKVYDSNRKKRIIERPQHLIMRVSLGIHGANLDAVIETYNLISQRYFTHATPTLFNAGSNRPQLSSCFLLGIDDDLDSILSQIKQCGLISKWAGGLGVHITSVRAKGSLIRGTNGLSEGIVPLCIVFNKLARYINQGGRRSGSIAVYIEPWHADIFEFCELRKQNTGNDDNRARDLFLSLWIPNLFMKRVEDDEMWSLMCPDECQNLEKTHGIEFEKLYLQYEQDGKYKKQVQARELWKHILECQIETGFPYMCYKDHVNGKSNQMNLGTIRSSNLCAEICQYSDAKTTAVCNLASICLPRYVSEIGGEIVFDYEKLIEVTRVIVRNLNKVIDINFYPTEETRESNKKNRPMGIGVQGLADVYNMFGYPYDSDEASILNKKIFETIYYGAISESTELAKKFGHYMAFRSSPFSQGKLQFHLWGMKIDDLITKDMYKWNELIDDVRMYGTRNSLLTALMPTAGTSQIMKCYESFEAYISNIFVKTTMAGEFIVINEHLVNDLIKLGLWSEDMRKMIIIKNGSVQDIPEIPDYIKNVYKTAFELKLKSIIKQSAERGPFIDQSQSMNLFMRMPDPTILTSAHFYAWKSGLKTGMYYLRGSSAVNPIQFGIDVADVIRLTGKNSGIELLTDEYDMTKKEETVEIKKCKYNPNKSAEGCMMCSS